MVMQLLLNCQFQSEQLLSENQNNQMRSNTESNKCDLISVPESQEYEKKENKRQQNVNQAQNQPQQQGQPESSSSSEQIDHYQSDTPLPKSNPLDLKAHWLGSTNKILQKFNQTYNQLKTEQKVLQEGFRIFQQSENKYKLSSLRKIQFKLDKKLLYDQFMRKTRKSIQKINPALLVNILSYVEDHLFLTLLRIRRVSKIFNQIFLNQSIQQYMAKKDYIYNQSNPSPKSVLKSSLEMCKSYYKFYKTFLYYKSMQYSEQIPQNSIMKDFEQSVSFINAIHRLVIEKKTKNFTYFHLTNNFMVKHRVVIGLSSLSLTSLVLVRKAAIIAFSNHLAFNLNERSKQQITKTKYSKVIAVVQYQLYRDCLILNTKVANYFWEKFGICFGVLVTRNLVNDGQQTNLGKIGVKSWNILLYHYHNQQNALYLQNIELLKKQKQHKQNIHEQETIQRPKQIEQIQQIQQYRDPQFYNQITYTYTSARFDIQFSNNMQICRFSTIQYLNWVQMEAKGHCMEIIGSQMQGVRLEGQNNYIQEKEEFSYCHVYKLQQYYVIAIPNKFQ